jgi:ankyrin repeat protein
MGIVFAVLLAAVCAWAQPAIEQKSPKEQLQRAVDENNLAAIKELLAANNALATTFIQEFGGYPLHRAMMQEGAAMAELFIAAGADVNAVDANAQHPLHIAASCGNVAAGRLLITKGAAIDARDAEGHTPLMVAVANGNDRFIDLLLTKGASPTAKDRQGRTLLHVAAGSRNIRSILMALQKGGDVKAVDESGYTPLHYVLINVNDGEIMYGVGRRANDDYAQSLDVLSEAEREAFINDVGTEVNDYTTALVKLFVKRGADVNAVTEMGRYREFCGLAPNRLY